MNVLQKAENRLADLQAVELILMRELNKAREHKTKVVEFIAMYRGFDAPEEPHPANAPEGQTGREVTSAEVTPAAVESVTAEEEPDTSSAPIQPETATSGETSSEVAAGESPAIPSPLGDTGGEHETHGVAEIPNSNTEAAKSEGLSAVVIENDDMAAGAGSGAGDSPEVFVSAVESGAPKIPVADQILALQADHPEWTANDFAEAIGVSPEHINAAARKRGGIVIAKLKPRRDNPSGLSLRQRVENVLAEHPGWTARQIADHLGEQQKAVASIARNNDLPVRKLSPEELLEARRLGGATGGAVLKARRGEPVEAREPPPAPTPPPEPERPPASTVPPPRAVNDDEIIPPEPRRVSRPRGKLFWLRDTDGKYLDRYCSALVRDRKAAWVGTEAQLAGCRRNFAIARDLREQVVEKEGAKV